MTHFLIAAIFLAFINSTPIFAEQKISAAGHLDFEKTCSESEVAKLGEQLVKSDGNFISMVEAETSENTFGLYFQYRFGPKIKSEKDLADAMIAVRKSYLKNCQNGVTSLSAKVKVIK